MLSKNSLKDLREREAIYFSKECDVEKITAKDVMKKPVILHSNDGNDKVLNKLKKENTSVCVIVDENEKYEGMINEKDIMKLFFLQVKSDPFVKLLNRGYRKSFIHKIASKMINKNSSKVTLDTPINEIIKLMNKKDYENIPVLDNNDKVLGIITPSSIINLLRNH